MNGCMHDECMNGCMHDECMNGCMHDECMNGCMHDGWMQDTEEAMKFPGTEPVFSIKHIKPLPPYRANFQWARGVCVLLQGVAASNSFCSSASAAAASPISTTPQSCTSNDNNRLLSLSTMPRAFARRPSPVGE
eukprot:GHVU01202774.1.p1 GENE.GHVU01202774.1~~GHVU01202774.1.p1  ORF type:complete len:134 (+),score=24.05 GHVU01202774.1:2-403(+)